MRAIRGSVHPGHIVLKKMNLGILVELEVAP